MSHIVAVDIGGTQIRVALYEPDSITPVSSQRTRSLANEPGVYDRLAQAVESVWPRDGVDAIGIASPGPLDPHTGTILATPNIPEWKNFPLTSRLSRQFGVPAYLDNDANMAGLAEWQFGAGKGHKDLVYLTISTGIGGGVISNGCLLQGFRGMGAELGHMIIDPNGPLCGCGHRGHVESFCSGPSITRYVKEQLKAGQTSTLRFDEAQHKKARPNLNAAVIAEAARAGDALAISAFERAGYYLGIAVANFLAIFDPSILIFGGGVSQVGEYLFKPFEDSLRKHTFHPHYLENLVITKAAGLLGALALARMKSV
jgi:glucokinase